MNGIQKLALASAIGVSAFGMSAGHAVAATSAVAVQKRCTAVAQGNVASLAQAAKNIMCSMRDRRLLIVGEVHGGDETPELVTDIVRDASVARPVRLGLEIPVEERAGLMRFLHSKGTSNDQAMLLQGKFWDLQDGRSSKAMFRMIDHLRALMASGADVDVFPMEQYGDAANIAQLGGMLAAKEAGMAKSMEQVIDQATSATLVVALMGNLHARYGKKFIPVDIPTPSVSERFKRFAPLVVLPFARQSNNWNCTDAGCGMHPVTSTSAPQGKLPQFLVDDSPVASLAATELWLPNMIGSSPAKTSDDGKK
ncbi:MAG TPA: hypothetical protein VGC19_07350 [Rhodanobacter sp.]